MLSSIGTFGGTVIVPPAFALFAPAQRKIKEVNANIQRSNQLKALLEHLLECRCGSLQLCVERLQLSPTLPLIAQPRNEHQLKRRFS